MKKKTFMYIMIFLSISGVALTVFFNKDKIGLALEDQKDYFLRPSFAYLSCSPIEWASNPFPMSGSYAQKDTGTIGTATSYYCQQFMGINDGCYITLQTTDGNLDGLATRQQLNWEVVPKGAPFTENAKEWLDCDGEGSPTGCGVGGYDGGERSNPIHLGKDDQLYVIFTESTGLINYHKVNEKMEFIVTGTGFTLYNHNDLSPSSGQPLAGAITGDCLLRDNYYKDKQIMSFSSEFTELNGQELDWVGLNAIYRTYTYMKGLEPAPYTFWSFIQTYNGQEVYCDRGTLNLYSIGEITSMGRTYDCVLYDSSGIVGHRNVCCDGDIQPNKVCQNDQWVDQEEFQCDLNAGKFCPEASWTPYAGKKCKRNSCVDNQCVPEYKDVECNFNSDCIGVNQVCQREFDCGGKCVDGGSGEICGDGICSLLEENGDSTCEPYQLEYDCKKDFGDINWVLIAIIAGIVLIILAIIVTGKKRK